MNPWGRTDKRTNGQTDGWTNICSFIQGCESIIQNGGSMTKIFAYKLGAACSNHSRFLALDSEHPKLKLGSIIDNSHANIILTRMIRRPLAWVCPKPLRSSSFWTICASTSKIAHKHYVKLPLQTHSPALSFGLRDRPRTRVHLRWVSGLIRHSSVHLHHDGMTASRV